MNSAQAQLYGLGIDNAVGLGLLLESNLSGTTGFGANIFFTNNLTFGNNGGDYHFQGNAITCNFCVTGHDSLFVNNTGDAPASIVPAHRVVTATGAYNTNWTISSTNEWDALTVASKSQ